MKKEVAYFLWNLFFIVRCFSSKFE